MKITVLGGGSFGTALANQLSFNKHNKVTILLRNDLTAKEINKTHTNSNYFPNRELHHRLNASIDLSLISQSDILFIAIPTKNIKNIIKQVTPFIHSELLIVNTSKGILEKGETIVDYLKSKLKHTNIISLKGGSFSAEMINNTPTLLTIGFENIEQLNTIEKIIKDTQIYTDNTTDIRGVELLSALKNIYAILLGHIDAKYNSANTRFLFLTKAYSELKIILIALGGKVDTLSLSCGIGDFSLTALNDLSRNRTLGLLIGKGFYNPSFKENSVVIEGIKTLDFIDKTVSEDLRKKLPLLNELTKLLSKEHSNKNELNLNFEKLLLKNYTTVLTYGTFDLLHYGHLEILRRAKEIGDRLIVGLSTDEFNKQKNKTCIINYEKRKQLLEALPYVDLVIPEAHWEQKADDIKNYQVDIFVMGSDWEGKFDSLNELCEVRYFPRTKGISTTKLKALLEK